MSLAKHAAFLVAFLLISAHAQAQFKNVAQSMPPMTAVPMTKSAPVASAAARETTGAPIAMIPGCPDGSDCPPEPEGLSDADHEMLKEFAKCAADGKSLDMCRSDNSASALSQLTEEDRAQLVQCLGSSDLSNTKERWSGCIVGAD